MPAVVQLEGGRSVRVLFLPVLRLAAVPRLYHLREPRVLPSLCGGAIIKLCFRRSSVMRKRALIIREPRLKLNERDLGQF